MRLYFSCQNTGIMAADNNEGRSDSLFEVSSDFLKANMPRTIRFTEKLFAELSEVAQREDVSFNMLVLQCCRYALDHMRKDDE